MYWLESRPQAQYPAIATLAPPQINAHALMGQSDLGSTAGYNMYNEQLALYTLFSSLFATSMELGGAWYIA